MRYIGAFAFGGCTGISTINVDSLETWCNIFFSDRYSNPLEYAHTLCINGNSLEEIIIPEGIQSISNYAFCNAKKIKKLTIANSVCSIGTNSFQDCQYLQSIHIGTGLMRIGDEYKLPRKRC